MNKSCLVLALLALAALQLEAQPAPAAPLGKPNIIYILVDDLGYGDVDGLYPAGKIKTPQLDKLVTQGMAFDETHSSSAVCTPSRYSILTGRYNWRSELKSGVLGAFSKPMIEEGRETVADLLRSQGYKTACIGKWHLGMDWALLSGAAMGGIKSNTNSDSGDSHEKGDIGAAGGTKIDFTEPIARSPITNGFDDFFGISASLDMPPYVFIHNDRVTELPTIPDGIMQGVQGGPTRKGPAAPDFKPANILPTVTQHAVDYVGQQAADARNGKPFFLYLALPSPHTPIAPTPEWLGKSGLSFYADYVMETDDCIGKVLAALDQNKLADNTLVVFASDNGFAPYVDPQHLMEKQGHYPSAGRRGYKADIYDGGHRIPCIVRWPGHVAPGTRTNDFVCLGDFMATCADILNVKLPDNAAEDSISFLPVLLGTAKSPPRDTLVESSINGSFAIRQGQWKLELCPDSGGWSYPQPGKDKIKGAPPFQLFDCVADPAEKTNVVDQHPDIVKRLGHLMRDYIINGRSTPGAPQQNDQVARWPQTKWMDEFK